MLGDGLRQSGAHAQAGVVDGDTVHHRVRAGEVDVLERARLELRGLGTPAGVQLALGGDEHGLAGGELTDQFVVAVLQDQGLGGDDPLVVGVRALLELCRGGVAASQHHRTDAEGVAEGEQTVVGDQCDDGVGALDATVDRGDGTEDALRREVGRAGGGLQLGGEDIEQQFGVTGGVDVPTVAVAQFLGDLTGVRQVAVVHQGDAVRGVDVEGLLLLLGGRRATGGVADVAEADVAEQGTHVPGAHDLTDLATGPERVQVAAGFGRGHTGGVLSSVLQEKESVVDVLVDRAVADHSDDAAHGSGVFLTDGVLLGPVVTLRRIRCDMSGHRFGTGVPTSLRRPFDLVVPGC